MRDPCFLSYRWHIRVSYPPTRKYQYRPILHYTVTTRLQICFMLTFFTVHAPNPKNYIFPPNCWNCKYFTANFKCSVISSLSIVKCRGLDHRFLVQAWLAHTLDWCVPTHLVSVPLVLVSKHQQIIWLKIILILIIMKLLTGTSQLRCDIIKA